MFVTCIEKKSIIKINKIWPCVRKVYVGFIVKLRKMTGSNLSVSKHYYINYSISSIFDKVSGACKKEYLQRKAGPKKEVNCTITIT